MKNIPTFLFFVKMYLRDFSGRLIFFNTQDGLKTAGFLMDAGKEDVVIFLHGMGGNFYKDGFLHGARELVRRGISFFSFNNRGAEVVKDFRDVKGEHHLLGTSFENFEECIYDIRNSIDLLESLGFRRFHLMGHSTGCQKILYYAYHERDGRVKSLIHISPAEDYEIWKNSLGEEFESIVEAAREMVKRGEGKKLLMRLYEKNGELWSASRFLSFASRENPEARMFCYEDLSAFSEVEIPTFVALGTEDEYFRRPVEWYADRLKKAYGGKKLRVEIMPGDHSFHGYEEKLFQAVYEFIKSLEG